MVSNPPPSLTSPPWSPLTKRTVALIMLGLLFLLVIQLLQAWSIVFVALILAYLLNPLVNFFENQVLGRLRFEGLRRSLAVLFTFITVILLLVLVIILVVPPITSQLDEFAETVPQQLEDSFNNLLDREITIGDRHITLSDEFERWMNGEGESQQEFDAVTTFRETASTLSSPLLGVASAALTFVFNFFFVLVMMFYLMKDGSKFIDRLDGLIPVEYQGDYRRMLYELSQIWNAYLRGQLVLGLAVGTVTGICASILGLPQPLVLALIAGLLEFIPNIGPILSSIPAILFALVSPSTTISGLEGIPFAVIVAATYSAIQQIEALFLVPRVMGHTLDLHPLVVIIAVISGAAVAGLLGLILAAPIVATMRLVLIYVWAKLVDVDPFSGKNLPRYPMEENILPDSLPPALRESFSPPQHGEIVSD